MSCKEEDSGFEIVPEGFDWGIYLFSNLTYLALFNWDASKSSKKLTIDDDQLTIKVKDGSGFKTSVGDTVIFHSISPYFYSRLFHQVGDTISKFS